MWKLLLIVGIIIVVGAGYLLFIVPENEENSDKVDKNADISVVSADVKDGESADTNSDSGETVAEESDHESEPEKELAEEEMKEQAEEKLVDEFDAETDRWMDAEKTKPPTMKDIDAFHAKFKKLPTERKDECIHRALNLIPDENVMLLVGILMDKSEDKELVETIYNDILNRDEAVKKPILQTIFKDKEHPCWADTAWILDVTGELPKKN